MTPAQTKAVVEAAPFNLLRAVTLHDVTGLDGDRAVVTAEVAGLGTFTAEVPVLYGPLPLAPDELLAVLVMVQSRLGQAASKFETDMGRGFNADGRGSLIAATPYRANDGWV